MTLFSNRVKLAPVSNFDSTLEEDIIEYNKSSNLKKLAYFIKIKEKHAILQILKESSKQ